MADTPDRPRRIQRRRTNGWRMPEGAIYVGRPTEWGNPYLVGLNRDGNVIRSAHRIVGTPLVIVGGGGARHSAHPAPIRLTAAQAVACYRVDALSIGSQPWFAELRGHDLACWCRLDQPCHADVLLELANQ